MGESKQFESLLPKEDVDLGKYKDALDFAIETDQIRNIALSGSYGSGKSSVIRSYEKEQTAQKFLHISLACFHAEGESANQSSSRPNVTKFLEGKILNQLLHQLHPSKIRQSQFHIKSSDATSSKNRIGIFSAIFALLLYFNINFSLWEEVVAPLPSWISWTSKPVVHLVSILVCFLMGGFSLYWILKTHSLLKIFKKIGLKGIVEFEIFGNQDDSYFDKYLNEVIYLFERSGADVIVFEDLDRYEVTQIFEKLKEISDLLYLRKQQRVTAAHSSKKRCKKYTTRSKLSSPKFLYLIRDDVFTSSDRSKFFDFIIPVVPVVATDNAYNLLLNGISDLPEQSKFEQPFLRAVSLYLSDLRLINNIINEYKIYSSLLSGSDLVRNPNQQFAIILYKNLYPKDFSDLRCASGYVYSVISEREALVAVQRTALESKRQEIQNRIALVHKEHLQNLDELDALFFSDDSDAYMLNGQYLPASLSRVEFVKELIESAESEEDVVQIQRNYYFNVNPLVDKMKKNPEYQRRKHVIEDMLAQQDAALNNQLIEIDHKLYILATQRLQDLLPDDESFWISDSRSAFEQITSSKEFGLLKYLIRHGYINENYAIYISFFYPGSLSVRDKKFILSINNRTNIDLEYSLDSPATVLDWIDDTAFSLAEIQNYSLFNYLLEQKKFHLLSIWLDSINERKMLDNSVFEFPISLWRHTPYQDYLVTVINEVVPSWFAIWTETGYLSVDNEWSKYAVTTLLTSTPEVLQQINKNRWLTNAISAHSTFLQIDNPDVESLIQSLSILDVHFTELDYRPQDLPLVAKVYEENLYALNRTMLVLWLTAFFDVSTSDALGNSYTHLLRHPEEPLSCRIEASLNEYLNVILEQSDQRFTDSAKAVSVLLNHTEIQEDLAKGYIQRLDTVLAMVTDIENRNLWPALFDNNAVRPTSSNILAYYKAFCNGKAQLDQHLVNMLQSNASKIIWLRSDVEEYIDDNEADCLYKKLIQCTNLPTDSYRTVLKAIADITYDAFEIRDLPDEYIAIVIDLGIIEINADNLDFVRRYYPEQVIRFLMQNNGSVTSKLIDQATIQLQSDELIGMLESGRLNRKVAMHILDNWNSTLSIAGVDCSPTVRVKVLTTCFDLDDINWFLVNYDIQTVTVQRAFLNLVQEYPKQFYAAAKAEGTVPTPVYARMLQILLPNQLVSLRELLPDKHFDLVCTTNQNPKFPESEDTRAILEYFRTQGWISSYKLRNGKYQAFSLQKKPSMV